MSADHAAATPGRMPMIGRIGWLPGALGAGLAIALSGWISHWLLRGDPAQPWLVASMGASAVLVFVLPASPLAQPRAVLGGHLLAACAGLAAHALPLAPWLTAGIGLALAIVLMGSTHTLHPPAGGTALITALASPAITALGWRFVAAPLGLNVLLLLGLGLAWHRLRGHSYPHRPAPIPAGPDWVGHIADEDLDAVLEEWDEVLSVSRSDLLALLHAVEARVRARRFS